MRKLLCAALLCAAAANAETLIATNGKDSVRITDGPCSAQVLPLIPESVREHFKGGSAVIEGKLFTLCWALRADGAVHLVFDDNDMGLIPASQFRPAPGV